mmetsp:Transcript_47150/g.118766  ORF Transcript_47150/g.118766 Transcript_47150/m.118766 type:complete len:286 (-) Transcript_47150:37-894(-)|eukprot:CAMPEP_0177651016 /NCGR_PEP_ID=MMETSP0447-20121125/12287_1 /TAXON_ID=0 /ORGANISM="Stygamoeba regulata, Strain BSH-02190019" /LENGTH=285 /DNA_ID=CAMNT_0019153997 /DNA_START=116 /DNA_END=973 /DNA_ORIENTATION=+
MSTFPSFILKVTTIGIEGCRKLRIYTDYAPPRNDSLWFELTKALKWANITNRCDPYGPQEFFRDVSNANEQKKCRLFYIDESQDVVNVRETSDFDEFLRCNSCLHLEIGRGYEARGLEADVACSLGSLEELSKTLPPNLLQLPEAMLGIVSELVSKSLVPLAEGNAARRVSVPADAPADARADAPADAPAAQEAPGVEPAVSPAAAQANCLRHHEAPPPAPPQGDVFHDAVDREEGGDAPAPSDGPWAQELAFLLEAGLGTRDHLLAVLTDVQGDVSEAISRLTL